MSRVMNSEKLRGARRSASLRTNASRRMSLHSVECFLEDLLIVSAAQFFAAAIDPSFFQGVFGGAIGFVKDAEDTGERQLRQFVSSELVGDIMAEFILETIVPFLFLDQLEGASLARVGRIEGAGEKLHA